MILVEYFCESGLVMRVRVREAARSTSERAPVILAEGRRDAGKGRGRGRVFVAGLGWSGSVGFVT